MSNSYSDHTDEPAEVPGTHAQQSLPHLREYPGLGKFEERLDWLRAQAETATTNGCSAAYEATWRPPAASRHRRQRRRQGRGADPLACRRHRRPGRRRAGH